MPLIVISLDALSFRDLGMLENYPNMSRFLSHSSLVGDVSSVFLTNTYPVHASVVTGVTPEIHRLISNTEPMPKVRPEWNCRGSLIKSKTAWRAAREKGLKTAAVMWPVTAYERNINFNIPEVMAPPGKSQILTSLKAGSVITSLCAFLKYHSFLNGIHQPGLDSFAARAMRDIIIKKRPDFALLHLTCYDNFYHYNGGNPEKLEPALKSLDENLGMIMDAAGKHYSIFIFSDHAQLNVKKCVNPNFLLTKMKLADFAENGELTRERCFFELCAGSAFFHNKGASPEEIAGVKMSIPSIEGFNRFLSPDEMKTCGRSGLEFGICAKPGFCFEQSYKKYKGNHGYPVEGYDDYTVFYAAYGNSYRKGFKTSGGTLLDLTALIARELGLDMPGIQGTVNKTILKETVE